jgi:membrane fusion protein (multidrug efflux system)
MNSIPFPQSERFLNGDRAFGYVLWMVIPTCLIAMWAAWLFLAQVPIYVPSNSARLEVSNLAHSVESPISGRIVGVHMAVGQAVGAGSVLVELDSEDQRLRVEEERSRQAGLAAQIKTLEGELKAEEGAQLQMKAAGKVEQAEARAKMEESRLGAQFSQEESARLKQLHAAGLLAEIEFLRVKTETERRLASAETLRLDANRLEWDHEIRQSNQFAKIERIRNDLARLESDLLTSERTLKRLGYEEQQHQVLAPVEGSIGEVANLQVGAYVRQGDRIASIIPRGQLRAVAQFEPSQALGRLAVGQSARMRLDGFPPLQYGTLPAKVSSVAREVRNELVRVELELSPIKSVIPFQHGLPGSVEVEVERISPATLLKRAAGKQIMGASTASP